MRYYLRLLLLIALVLPGTGCTFFLSSFLGRLEYDDCAADPRLCLISAAEATVAWDPPPTPVASYRLFYRSHGTEAWIFLAEIPATGTPQHTLYRSDFGNGDFDFGVVAVGENAAQSAMHTSLDETAYPEGGWYLRWE